MISLAAADIVVFVLFLALVIGLGLSKSRDEKDSESYFLAGRGIKWWLIGFSLIAANISTEQFVGMSGQAADYIGLAVATWEWLAGITLVVCAFFVLPKFLRAGVGFGGGCLPSRICYWYTELGIKQVYVCPDLNYGAAVHADNRVLVLANAANTAGLDLPAEFGAVRVHIQAADIRRIAMRCASGSSFWIFSIFPVSISSARTRCSIGRP